MKRCIVIRLLVLLSMSLNVSLYHFQDAEDVMDSGNMVHALQDHDNKHHSHDNGSFKDHNHNDAVDNKHTHEEGDEGHKHCHLIFMTIESTESLYSINLDFYYSVKESIHFDVIEASTVFIPALFKPPIA